MIRLSGECRFAPFMNELCCYKILADLVPDLRHEMVEHHVKHMARFLSFVL